MAKVKNLKVFGNEVYTDTNHIYHNDTLLSEKLNEKNIVLLWTNPNPNNEFAPQTLNLDLSNYSVVEIWAKQTETNGVCNFKIIKNSGNASMISFAWLGGDYGGDCMLIRNANVKDNSIAFTSAHGLGVGVNSSSKEYNHGLKPIYIVGYK